VSYTRSHRTSAEFEYHNYYSTATVSVKNKMNPTTIDSAALETTTGSVIVDSSTTSKSVNVVTQAIAKNNTPTPFSNLNLRLKLKFRLRLNF